MAIIFATLVGTAAAAAPSAPLAVWRNSTVGIHAFLTFDAYTGPANIAKYGTQIDYVWGAEMNTLVEWRKSNPDVVLR